jgi:preprotein translocase subunit SecE
MSATDAQQQANRAEMDPRRLVVIAYLVFGLIIAMFFGHVLELAFVQLNVPNTKVIEGLDFTYAFVAGAGLAVALGVWAWVNVRVHTLSSEVATELMRVTWPSFEETRVSTIAVIVASLVAAVVLFGIDSLALKVMVDWLPHLWGKI